MDSIQFVRAHPDFGAKIQKSQKVVMDGGQLPSKTNNEFLDSSTLNLIKSISDKTNTNVAKTTKAVIGTKKVLVILVDFSDTTAVTTQDHFNQMFFSLGEYPTGSLRDYYKEISYNKLDIIGTVNGNAGITVGWYSAPNPKSFYTNNQFGIGEYPQNSQKLVEELVDLADIYINFSEYDNDGDGIVDTLIVIAAGSAGEVTGNKNDFWSHAWSISPKTVDGIKIKKYLIGSEDCMMGTIAHELGHSLMGFPDLYDTDYSSSGNGNWDLMGSGSWNNGGLSPAHPTCYCKLKAGWLNPQVIFDAQSNVSIKPYATNAQTYKLPIENLNSKEYFLITNRKKTGFDSFLPGEGLLIEHVDESQEDNIDEVHYLVDIEEGDGCGHLNKGLNQGDRGDPFPVNLNNVGYPCNIFIITKFSGKSYYSPYSNIFLSHIEHSGNNINTKITVGRQN